MDKSLDGVLGIQTRGSRMEGTNESSELQRHPKLHFLLYLLSINFCIQTRNRKIEK